MQPYFLLVLKHMLENMVTSSCTFRSTQIKSPEWKIQPNQSLSHPSSVQGRWPLGPLYSRTGNIIFYP